jgi:hypothetical protein
MPCGQARSDERSAGDPNCACENFHNRIGEDLACFLIRHDPCQCHFLAHVPIAQSRTRLFAVLEHSQIRKRKTRHNHAVSYGMRHAVVVSGHRATLTTEADGGQADYATPK